VGSLEASIEQWNGETPGAVNRTVALEWLLALVVTDALSRTGSEHILNTTGPVSSWTIRDYIHARDFQNELFRGGHALVRPNMDGQHPVATEAKLEITIGGFSYQATSLTDYLAIALLALHIVVSLSHVALLFRSGESSSAWASIAELLVLAQNSRPADVALRDANVGIGCAGTYAKMARVYTVTRWDADGRREGRANVELVFDERMDTGNGGTDVALAGLHYRRQNPWLQRRDSRTIVVLGDVERDVVYGYADGRAGTSTGRRLSSDRVTI
jgi:hypothetical protein